ncbi:MAG TPA: DUF3617 family protein [Acetobacteraceae bacterium]|nr:DUF3617 family protein [Acetobacteraceae bacterium]
MAVLGATASAATLPPRRPGFWQTTMTMEMTLNGKSIPKGAPTVTAMCTDAATDAIEMKKLTGNRDQCANAHIAGSGKTYTMTSSCADPMGGTGKLTTHTTFTILSHTAMHMESVTKSPHMSGHIVSNSKWLGACPAGVVPGDVGHMMNGKFVKLTNIKGAAKAP